MLVRTHVSDGRPNRIAVWDARGAVGACPLTRSLALTEEDLRKLSRV